MLHPPVRQVYFLCRRAQATMLAAITKRPLVVRGEGFCENGSVNRRNTKASPAEKAPGRARASDEPGPHLSLRPRLVRFSA